MGLTTACTTIFKKKSAILLLYVLYFSEKD